MPMYVVNCIDKPDSVELRLATRPTHLAYMGAQTVVRLGGPYFDDQGRPCGSMIIVEVADQAAAQAFSAADPYSLAGLFQSVEIREWRYVAGPAPVSARPAPGLALCRLDEIADPGARGFRFRAGEAEFAGFVVRRGDAVAGYVDRCPHAGWPLAMVADRYLTREKDLILCSGHGALFRTDDGACIAGPCAGAWLEPWPVAARGGEVVTA